MGSVQCAACGASVPGSLTFCTTCGARLTLTEPAAPTASPAPGAPPSRPVAAPSEAPTRPEMPIVVQASDLRRYSDDVLTTASGEAPSAALPGNIALALPYPSTDVLRRIGPYDLLSELGRGETGAVYAAFSRRLVRPCALRVMIAGEHAPEADIRRFQQRASRVAALDHPNIVTVFDSGEERGRFYFATRFVEGRAFRALIDDVHRTRSLDVLASAVRVLAKSARALHFAHEAGFVHCDIQPGNILVDAEGEPHITDFGIARQVRVDQLPTMPTATIAGTPSYMSPEQASGSAGLIGPRSDVFALGALLYDLCTGRPPFVSEASNDTISTIMSLLTEPPEPAAALAARQLGWSLAPDLEAICHKAIAQQPEARYSSAAALATALEAWLDKRALTATAPLPLAPGAPASTRTRPPAPRRPPYALVALVVAGLVAAGFGFVVSRYDAALDDSARELAVESALADAEVVERAIRQHMLEGRPDLTRSLVRELRAAPAARGIDVLRVDRTPAFNDLSTRLAVEARLAEPSQFAWAQSDWPALPAVVKSLREQAFPKILDDGPAEVAPFEYPTKAWDAMLARGLPVADDGPVGGQAALTVLKPIANDAPCQVCHGGVEQGVYGPKNAIRAVIAVRRSKATLAAQRSGHRAASAGAGIATALALLAALWLIARRHTRERRATKR
jgi:serine/threonine protein kinase